ncbi:hypothetical protein GQ457_15G018150 [Hibiscus cannabinus]
MEEEEEDFKLQIEAVRVEIKVPMLWGNSLWTFVGSDALARVIPYGLLFRCFGSGNPLWTSVGSDALAWVIPYGLLEGNPLWILVSSSGLNGYMSGRNKYTYDQSSAQPHDPVILALPLQRV